MQELKHVFTVDESVTSHLTKNVMRLRGSNLHLSNTNESEYMAQSNKSSAVGSLMACLNYFGVLKL